MVQWDKESPTEMEKIEFQKKEEKLKEEREELELIRKELDQEKGKLKAQREELEQLKNNIRVKEKRLKEQEKESETREEQIRIIAQKVSSMPPAKAVEMLVNWPDTDIIEVFKQMDKNAEEEGRQTITTYLLTLFEPARRSVLANKWLDSDANKVPIIIPDNYNSE